MSTRWKLCRALAAAAAATLIWTSTSPAVGLGGYIEGGGGSGEFEIADRGEFDVDGSFGALGFVLDTAPSGDHMFNYRLHVGLESLELEADTPRGITMEMGGLVIDNTLGIGLLRKERARLWLGPQLRLGIYGGESDTSVRGEKWEGSLAAFGLGVVVGLNANLGESLCLSLSGGARSVAYAGEIELFGVEEDWEGHQGQLFVNLALMFDTRRP